MDAIVEMTMWFVICIGLPALSCIFTNVAVWRKIIGFIAMAIGLFYLMEGFFSAELNEFAHFVVIIVFLISAIIAFFPKNIYIWVATVILLISNIFTYPSARKNNLQAHIEWAKNQNPYSTVESAKENIKNTTWQHTQKRLSTSKWYKLHFDNEDVEMHDAWPSDGKWTNKGTYTYEIIEVRSPDDGHKCIEIRWGNRGIKYTFDMETSTLTEYLVGVGTQPPVYMQQEDQNPWRD